MAAIRGGRSVSQVAAKLGLPDRLVRYLLLADDDNEPVAVADLRQLNAGQRDDDYHDVLERRLLSLQNRIGPTIRVLAFQDEAAATGCSPPPCTSRPRTGTRRSGCDSNLDCRAIAKDGAIGAARLP